jgi:hypothetical protein
MVKINVMHKDPVGIMELVKKLRDEGLVQGQDFDFAFYQSKWDEMIGEIPKHTVFTFYIEKHATLFALKYGS